MQVSVHSLTYFSFVTFNHQVSGNGGKSIEYKAFRRREICKPVTSSMGSPKQRKNVGMDFGTSGALYALTDEQSLIHDEANSEYPLHKFWKRVPKKERVPEVELRRVQSMQVPKIISIWKPVVKNKVVFT